MESLSISKVRVPAVLFSAVSFYLELGSAGRDPNHVQVSTPRAASRHRQSRRLPRTAASNDSSHNSFSPASTWADRLGLGEQKALTKCLLKTTEECFPHGAASLLPTQAPLSASLRSKELPFLPHSAGAHQTEGRDNAWWGCGLEDGGREGRQCARTDRQTGEEGREEGDCHPLQQPLEIFHMPQLLPEQPYTPSSPPSAPPILPPFHNGILRV